VPLTTLERAILELEREWPLETERSSKREAVHARIGISTARYYAILASLVDSPDALSHDPLTVRRLRRRRDERRRSAFIAEQPREHRPR